MALTPLRPGQGLHGAAMWMHCNGNGAQFPSTGEGGTTANAYDSIFAPRIANAANEPLAGSSFVYDDTLFTLTLANAFDTYEWSPLDVVEISGGTSMTAGFYNVLKRIDGNTIQTTNCGTADSTDATLRLYDKEAQVIVYGGVGKLVTSDVNSHCWLYKGNGTGEYEVGIPVGHAAGATVTLDNQVPGTNFAGGRGILLRSGFACAMIGATDEATVFFSGA